MNEIKRTLIFALYLLTSLGWCHLHEFTSIMNGKIGHPTDWPTPFETAQLNKETELVTVLSAIYTEWGDWSGCKEETGVRIRRRLCKIPHLCANTTITEEKKCSKCETNKNCRTKPTSSTRTKQASNFHVVKEPSATVKRIGTPIETIAGGSGSERLESKNVYSKWSKWTTCTKSCLTQRFKWCKRFSICGNEVIQQTAYCYTEGSYCQRWIHSQGWTNLAKDLINNSISQEYSTQQTASSSILHQHSRGMTGLALEGREELKFSCGVIKNNKSSFSSSNWNFIRIIGGRPTQQGKWPWQVAILNRYKEAFCGGTLVAPKWVLTAAHCIRRRLYVRLGEHDLSHREGTELQIRVKKMIIHPSYNSETVDNDIALLQLPYAVPLDTFAVACLPKYRQQLPIQQLCTIIGWGKRSTSDLFGTDVLHEAEVPIIANKQCRDVYEDYQITDNMFCAGYRKGRKDSCAGDSGGPLMCKNSRGRWTVFGVTSFGEGCGKRGKYGIYARLSNYVRWIKRVIGLTSKRTRRTRK